jgi:hypothetical protein
MCRRSRRDHRRGEEGLENEFKSDIGYKAQDRHCRGNHGDQDLRTEAQRDPHRKLGVNWERSNCSS